MHIYLYKRINNSLFNLCVMIYNYLINIVNNVNYKPLRINNTRFESIY